MPVLIFVFSNVTESTDHSTKEDAFHFVTPLILQVPRRTAELGFNVRRPQTVSGSGPSLSLIEESLKS